MLKADFHIHTEYSMDCEMEVEDIIKKCLEKGITCLSVCDHGTTEGAIKMKEIAPFKVIVSEEILTPNGEIMGMFLQETIPSGITVEQAIYRIREQGGLVCLPHPFDPFRGLSLTMEQFDAIADNIDVIEVFNARSPINSTADKAVDYAGRHGLPGTAGTDSHTLREIGHTFVELPEFETPKEFLESLWQGKITQRKASILVHLNSTWTKIKRKI